jgi:3-hydroxymyristoyl/3-hydroxydecanoyl-(acyl carrier protein) dehydratase
VGGKPALFGPEHFLAFAVGKPSEAFGEPYKVFDAERVMARIPGPPFSFLTRVTHIEAEAWKLVAGGRIVAEYDVPPDAWYFASARQGVMPFAVLMEVALQSCGWLAAYLGAALTSPLDLRFRNLGGSGELLGVVRPDAGTLTTHVHLRQVSRSAGLIILEYSFEVQGPDGPVYRGTTNFGFFSQEALGQQAGLRDAQPYEPGPEERARGRSFDYPRTPPFPDERLGMIDRVALFVPDGGPHGLGFVEGVKVVRPEEWFFKAHFYQDPVWPGSLGVESFLQLLELAAAAPHLPRGPGQADLRLEPAPGSAHRWLYRGQVIPTSREVRVQAVVTSADDGGPVRRITGDGLLAVDGLTIYRMTGFTVVLNG